MRFALVAVSALFAASEVFAGFALTVENDVFQRRSTDKNYTHGMEAMYTFVSTNRFGWELVRESYGLRSRMYSPDDITDPNPPPPDSRPWAGLTTVYGEWWMVGGIVGDWADRPEAVKVGLEAGMMGPWSGCEWMQTEFHKLVGSAIPMGWDNQMPNEPALNAYMDRLMRIGSAGETEKLSGSLDFVYGGTLGTTFINAKTGLAGKFGWNMPKTPVDNIVGPKLDRGGSKFFAGFVGDVNGWYQAWNSTIGNSMFRHSAWRDSLQRELEPFVWEYSYGGIVGYGGCSVTYRRSVRSDEFIGQAHDQSWGMISLTFGRTF